jgi:hypothetical protein
MDCAAFCSSFPDLHKKSRIDYRLNYGFGYTQEKRFLMPTNISQRDEKRHHEASGRFLRYAFSGGDWKKSACFICHPGQGLLYYV